MSIFTQLFFSVFNHYKPKYKVKANTIARYYISFLESAFVFALGTFFAVFCKQLNVSTITSSGILTFSAVAIAGVWFKNWMMYSGRSRKALNAKQLKTKTPKYSISLLWVLPFALVGLGLVLLQQL